MANMAVSEAKLPQAMPRFSLKKERHGSRIKIGAWSVAATKKPILAAKEIEAAEKKYNLPLPEMTFGNNSLFLSYDPETNSAPPGQAVTSTSSSSKQTLHFDALDALGEVATGEGWEERIGGGVQVSMAETWSKSRKAPTLLSDAPLPSKPVKPHDWTYSTCYSGSTAGPSRFQPSTTSEIPMELLARRDPILDQILYYEDVPLFEDELHDHGESILNVRIRVMPHSFFILCRLFVRVDNVVFRIHDVRIYHQFGTNEVIREVSGMEAGYDEVKQRLKKPQDLSPLTDQTFVHEVMTSIAERKAAQGGNISNEKEIKPWPGLGRKVEVLKLAPLTSGTEYVKTKMEELAL